MSSLAQQTGYLHTVCSTLIEQLENLPGDARAQVGFVAYNSAIHFYNIAEGYNQPHEVTVLDVDGKVYWFPILKIVYKLSKIDYIYLTRCVPTVSG